MSENELSNIMRGCMSFLGLTLTNYHKLRWLKTTQVSSCDVLHVCVQIPLFLQRHQSYQMMAAHPQ